MNKKTILALACAFILAFASTSQAVDINAYSTHEKMPEPLSLSETINWLEEFAPEAMLADIEKIREIDPQAYEDLLFQGAEEIPFIEDIRVADPESFQRIVQTVEIEIRSELLALQYQHTNSKKDKAKLKTEIEELTQKVFDSRMEEHNMMVQEIEAELKDLKKMGEMRSKNRSRIIERRVNDLTTPEDSSLEWW